MIDSKKLQEFETRPDDCRTKNSHQKNTKHNPNQNQLTNHAYIYQRKTSIVLLSDASDPSSLVTRYRAI